MVTDHQVDLAPTECIVAYEAPGEYASFPQLVRTDQSLVIVFQMQLLEGLKEKDLHPHHQPVCQLRYLESRDDGRTWSAHKTCPALGKVLDISYGSAPRTDGGTVSLTFSQDRPMKAIIEHGRIGTRPYHVKNADPSQQHPIDDLGPYDHALPFGMTRLPSGDIVAACYMLRDKAKPPGQSGTVMFLTSQDQGVTWRYLSGIQNNNLFTFSETAILPVANGELLAVLRTDWGDTPAEQRPEDASRGYGYFLYQSRSSDGGRQWSKPEQLPIWGHPPHLLRLQSGNILMVYGHRREPYSIRAVLSRDDGKSWDMSTLRTLRTFCPGHYDLGYPVATQVSDGAIICAYYGYSNDDMSLYSPHSIYVNRFTESWLLP
ncbi:sialidase family protein [Phycisphaerales bacterium AB-hyl4]|uniref:exo-alpha-sialidase n=1 Tax=Natronomicrosphaera hydrolytica TaxID=3242702 RepID=A0ABV4U5I3_9BACT